MAPIRIQSQALRRREAAAQSGIFPVLPELSAAARPGPGTEWQQADVKRAIDAAEEAGLAAYRIDLAPDGTISLIVGDPACTADPDSCAPDG